MHCILVVLLCVYHAGVVSVCFLAHSSREDDDAQDVHAVAGTRLCAHHHVRRRCQVQLEVADVTAVFAVVAVVLEIVDECTTCHT